MIIPPIKQLSSNGCRNNTVVQLSHQQTPGIVNFNVQLTGAADFPGNFGLGIERVWINIHPGSKSGRSFRLHLNGGDDVAQVKSDVINVKSTIADAVVRSKEEAEFDEVFDVGQQVEHGSAPTVAVA